jgi:hypothetical protein
LTGDVDVLNLDPKLLLETWSEDFCKECFEVKKKYVNGEVFSLCGGRYGNYSDLFDGLNNQGLSCFTELFYLPNITALDYFAKNRERHKDDLILDYGCGMGFLVIFLRRIGLNVIGYDNYSLIKEPVINNVFKYFDLTEYKKTREEIDSLNITVLVDIGAPFSDGVLLNNIRYLMFDFKKRFEGYLEDEKFYLEDKYAWGLEIYRNLQQRIIEPL